MMKQVVLKFLQITASSLQVAFLVWIAIQSFRSLLKQSYPMPVGATTTLLVFVFGYNLLNGCRIKAAASAPPESRVANLDFPNGIRLVELGLLATRFTWLILGFYFAILLAVANNIGQGGRLSAKVLLGWLLLISIFAVGYWASGRLVPRLALFLASLSGVSRPTHSELQTHHAELH